MYWALDVCHILSHLIGIPFSVAITPHISLTWHGILDTKQRSVLWESSLFRSLLSSKSHLKVLELVPPQR
jgi:hypothetical protein